MMSQLREDLLNAIGATYQRFAVANSEGKTALAERALLRLCKLRSRLDQARRDDKMRYIHVKNGGQSCMICQDEDSNAVIVQAWNSCEGCEITRFRSIAAARSALQQAGYVSMSAV